MRTIFHITHKSDWETAQRNGRYEADTLKLEGFIHLSRPHQVLKVGDNLFKGKSDLLLLQVHQELVNSELKYEGEKDNLFPHIYGPLNLEAVIGVHEFRDSGDGFSLPDGFSLIGDTLIRQGLPGDEAELASCHTHAWQQSYRGLVPDQVLDSRPLSFRRRMLWWRSVVRGKTPTTVFVAESAENGIIGFCAVEPARDEVHGGKGEVTAIYCLNEYKGKGIGAALFQMGKAHLKEQNFPGMYLWVLKNNPTIKFYQSMGGKQMIDEKTIDLGGLLPEIGFEWDLTD
jgi:uncharacterized protein (DUF952 family)/ribosomal protein S18 acetylase RimI-like enzyme